MGAPINYSHITTADISLGRKYHVTDTEMAILSGLGESGLSGTSTSFFSIADDVSGTNSRYVQLNTVVLDINGTSRTIYYE